MRKILCFFRIHQYEDKIHLSTITDKGIPVTASEVCKGCGKVRNHITGWLEHPAMKGVTNGKPRE
jgi:hypothetical protein